MLNELGILDSIASVLVDPTVLADDAYFDEASRTLYTTDVLVEGHHFSLDYFSAADLGWKAGAVNLSDVAAMGGTPQFLLVGLGLPNDPRYNNPSFIQGFYQGLQAVSAPYGAKIVGGDTVGAEQLVISITATGQLAAGHTLGRRSGAQPGDIVITTGNHGLSAAGLTAFQEKLDDLEACKAAHLRPIPQIEAGLALSKTFSRYALMDSSDGLADAVLKIAQASQVSVALEVHRIPLHPELKAFCCETRQVPLTLALYGGEDFQLVATVPRWEESLAPFFKPIGRVVAGEPTAYLVDTKGEKIETLSMGKTYQHFKEEP